MAKATKRAPGIYICVDRDGWTKGMQLSIDQVDADGAGTGFRISGPKFNGSSANLMRVHIDKRTADEIRSYLDKVTE